MTKTSWTSSTRARSMVEQGVFCRVPADPHVLFTVVRSWTRRRSSTPATPAQRLPPVPFGSLTARAPKQRHRSTGSWTCHAITGCPQRTLTMLGPSGPQ